MISDLLFKNQIRWDVFNSYTHLLKTTFNVCNKNPRTVNVPMVSNLLKYIFFVFKINMYTFYRMFVICKSLENLRKKDNIFSSTENLELII